MNYVKKITTLRHSLSKELLQSEVGFIASDYAFVKKRGKRISRLVAYESLREMKSPQIDSHVLDLRASEVPLSTEWFILPKGTIIIGLATDKSNLGVFLEYNISKTEDLNYFLEVNLPLIRPPEHFIKTNEMYMVLEDTPFRFCPADKDMSINIFFIQEENVPQNKLRNYSLVYAKSL